MPAIAGGGQPPITVNPPIGHEPPKPPTGIIPPPTLPIDPYPPSFIFYVSKNGPADGTADGSSWAKAFPELNAINWSAVQHSANYYSYGVPYPSKTSNQLVCVVVKIDGGPAGSCMVYTTPLHPYLTISNPNRVIAVISSASNESADSGQVILDGTKDKNGYPAIDGSDQFGCEVWGTATGETDPWQTKAEQQSQV